MTAPPHAPRPADSTSASDPSLPEALERAATATLAVIEKRIDLVEHDVRAAARRIARRIAGALVVILLGTAAWYALNGAALAGLRLSTLPEWAAWLVVAAANGLAAWTVARKMRAKADGHTDE